METSGSGSSSEDIALKPFLEVDQAIKTINIVKGAISSVTWNKNQCERIAQRFNAIGERIKRMGWNRDSGKTFDSDLIYDRLVQELVKVLEKGRDLIIGYSDIGITSTIVSRTDNREAFEEIHEELDTLEANFGFQDFELTPGTKNLLKSDADNDKKDMVNLLASYKDKEDKQTSCMERSEKVESVDVVLEKAKTNSVNEAGATSSLPSYLRVDRRSQIHIDKVQRVHEYKPQNKRDPKKQDRWASVQSGTWLGCDFAIKMFKCGSNAIRAEWNESQLLMEVKKLVELQHPHVVRLVGFGEDKEACVFVMELMKGDLGQLIETRLDRLGTSRRNAPDIRPFTDSEEHDIINQIAKGMYFMHKKGYSHGDLKCSNILVNDFGKYFEVKIADFRGSQNLDKDWDDKAFEHASTIKRPRWTAPEAVDHYGPKRQPSKDELKQSDVYSFGMTCFEIVTGRYPFHGVFQENGGPLLKCIKEDQAEKHNPFPEELDEDLKGLIASCWNKEPSKRPTFDTICHLLDTIKSKKFFEDVTRKTCEGMAATIFKQIPDCIEGVRSVVNEDHGNNPPKLELLRSFSIVKDVPGHLMIRDPEELKRSEEPIGEGRHGRVFKATWLGCTFAVKILNSRSKTTDLQREVGYLIQVSRHPCIVQMVGLSQNNHGEHSIVMEYMDSNLRQLIENRRISKKSKNGCFSFAEAVLIITKIAWGMAYLHSRGLVHRDLNPSNVLAQDYDRTVDVKIMDFGVSYLADPSQLVSVQYYRGVGSGFYRAPKMLPIVGDEVWPAHLQLPDRKSRADLNALKATDVYSFGMISREVLTGDSPWSHLKPTDNYAEVRKGQYKPTWPVNSRPEWKLLIELIERCWSMAPKERPTFIEICKRLREIFEDNLQLQRH